ncbi:MAG: response regulator [Spirochaetes bacterium]|nr:response regulator [Spirochaetota bacterium]
MPTNADIILVDDDEQILRLTEEMLTDSGFSVRAFNSPLTALASLKASPASAVISDIDMPGQNGIAFADEIRKVDDSVPIIFLTGMTSYEYAKEAIRLGATEFIEKPLKNVYTLVEIVRTAVRKREERRSLESVQSLYRALVQTGGGKQTDAFYDLQEFTIRGWAKLIEQKDTETGNHMVRIAQYSGILADALSVHPAFAGYLTKEYIQDLKLGSILHDIGKASVPDAILMKPGKLTPDEFTVIKQHVSTGGEFLDSCLLEWHEKYPDMKCYFNLGAQIAKFHHERWDGTGYTAGLSRSEIPLSARIVAIADVYDALTSIRPYKKAWPHDEAVAEIQRSRGTHFDPTMIDVFSTVTDRFAAVRANYP